MQKQISDHLSAIRRAVANDDYLLANGGLISVLEIDPLCVEANRIRSLLRASVGDFPEALASAVILTAVEPKHAAYWRLRGEIEIELRFRSSAIRSLNTAIELGFDDSEIKRLLEAANCL